MSLSTKKRRSQKIYVPTEEDLAIKSAKGEAGFQNEIKKGIVPDVLSENGLESNLSGLLVKYPSTVTKVGMEMEPKTAKEEPIVDWFSDTKSYYTLSMTDPDAPSRADPKFGEWQHWLVVNIPSNELHNGEYLTEYVGPMPPKGTGLHRYIFLLFLQPNGTISFKEAYKGKDNMAARKNFDTKAFVKKYNLGKAVAGYYFQAQTK